MNWAYAVNCVKREGSTIFPCLILGVTTAKDRTEALEKAVRFGKQFFSGKEYDAHMHAVCPMDEVTEPQ